MNPRLRRIIESIDSLPTLPDTATRIIELADRENYHVSEIVTIIEKDPSVATRVLKVANSPFYGFLGRISSIDHAVALLGVNELKNIVLASALSIYFGNGKSPGNISLPALWKHSVITAFVSRMLGEEFNEADVASLFLIGLIHDIGYVIISKYLPDEYSRLMEVAREEDSDMYSLEKKIIGATHCEIGAMVLKSWRFPPKVVLSVLFHHEPWRDNGYPLISTITCFADTLTRILGYSPNALEKKYELDKFLSSPAAMMVAKSGFTPSSGVIERMLRRIDHNISSSGDLSSFFTA